MRIAEIQTQNKTYKLAMETWSTSNAWGHKTWLFDEFGNEIATNKVRYYNRTWESYEYQTCLLGMIREFVDTKRNEYIARYKDAHNITRLTGKKRDEALEKFEALQIIKDMREIQLRLRDRI